jgi:hypothetical protein
VGTNESAEIFRSWRELYRAALFETDTNSCHRASNKLGAHSSFDPDSCLQRLPITTAKLTPSRMPFMPSKRWRIA